MRTAREIAVLLLAGAVIGASWAVIHFSLGGLFAVARWRGP